MEQNAATTTARAGRRSLLGLLGTAFGAWLARASRLHGAPRADGHATQGAPSHDPSRLEVRGGWLLGRDDR